MSKYRVELDDGTGTFVVLDIEAEDQNAAEDIAFEQVKARPSADPELVVIVSAQIVE